MTLFDPRSPHRRVPEGVSARRRRWERLGEMRGAGLILGVVLLASSASAQTADTASPSGAMGFMATNAKAQGVITLPSGLEYKVFRSGPAGGVSPKLGDQVRVDYEGRLLDGTVFDSSASSGGPATFPVGELIAAWNEALQLMRPGDQWVLYVPPELGYGPKGKGPIPPDSVMIFTLSLLDVQPAS